jgi:hypothetical protein
VIVAHGLLGEIFTWACVSVLSVAGTWAAIIVAVGPRRYKQWELRQDRKIQEWSERQRARRR